MLDASFVPKTCVCGSGHEPHELRDARGIGCGMVCDACEHKARARYRPEIFINPNYRADDLGEPWDSEFFDCFEG